MKNIVILCYCTLVISPAWSQFDEKRMQRDLDISKNVLSSLLNEKGNNFISGRRIDASYVEDFGVIIKIPRGVLSFNFNFPMPEAFTHPNVVIPNPDQFNDGSIRIYSDHDVDIDYEMEMELEMKDAEKEMKDAEREMKKAEKEMRKAEAEMKEQQEVFVQKFNYSGDGSALDQMEESESELEELIITFLADYADLIGQLKHEDKIVVRRDSGNENIAMIWNDGENYQVHREGDLDFSITAQKKDISDYKAGKINRDAFVRTLDIKKGEKKERIADLEIFGNVCKQYFSPEYSKTYFISSRPDYERLEGLGVIFHVRTYSSMREEGIYKFSTGTEEVYENDEKEKIEALYPQFINDLKSFVVDYGRTIRSMNEDEKLVMKIEMTRCEECTIPKMVEVTVPFSTLSNYDRQKISREKALTEVSIKEIK